MTSATHDSGPEAHPAQAEERDPPPTSTAVMLFVGTAILVVIVFALEVLYSSMISTHVATDPTTGTSLGARVRDEQVRLLEAGTVPNPANPTAPLRGKPIGQAMDDTVKKYGKEPR